MRFAGSRRAPVLVILALVAGCGDDDEGGTTQPEGVTIADFVGSWTAASVVYTNNADPGEQFDIIANGGEVRVTVLSDGRARNWIEFGTFSDEFDSQLTVSGNTLTSVPAEAVRPTRSFTFAFEGNTLVLTDAGSEFDFTLSGAAPVSSTEVTTFVPN